MIKGICFDYDGTLSNYTESIYNKYRIVMHELLPDVDINSIEFEAIIQQCVMWDEGGMISKRIVFERIRDKYKVDIDSDKMKYDWYMSFYENQVLNDDCIEVLEYLKKKYKLGLVTNGWSKAQHAKIDKVNIGSYFDTIVVSDDIGIQKPDPGIFLYAAKEMNLKPEEIVFIGDSYITDMIGAYRANMKPVWLCSDLSRRSQFELLRIVELKDLLELEKKDFLIK